MAYSMRNKQYYTPYNIVMKTGNYDGPRQLAVGYWIAVHMQGEGVVG